MPQGLSTGLHSLDIGGIWTRSGTELHQPVCTVAAGMQGRGGGGTWGSRTRKRREAGCGRPVDRGAWTAKTVKRPPQQPTQPQYANYWAPLMRNWDTMPHPAQPQHTNHWAPRTRKRHQQEHRPQRPTERSDPTQHAKGRTGDCPGPRKGTATRRTTQKHSEAGGGRQRPRNDRQQSAQLRYANYGAPPTPKRHQQEHRPQRPTELSDPTQHAGPVKKHQPDGMSHGGGGGPQFPAISRHFPFVYFACRRCPVCPLCRGVAP